MSFELGLAGRRPLVTGGTMVVGAALVAALHGAGAKVFATARKVPSRSADVQYIAADMTSSEGCATVAREVLARLGGPDILIHVLGGSSAPAGRFAALGTRIGERSSTSI